LRWLESGRPPLGAGIAPPKSKKRWRVDRGGGRVHDAIEQRVKHKAAGVLMNSIEPTRPAARVASSAGESKPRSEAHSLSRTGPAASSGTQEPGGPKVRKMLTAQHGKDAYTSWFSSTASEPFDGHTVHVTVP